MLTIKDLFDLSGRVAIVTGGSRGLGQEIAEGLAEAGASLMLCARREEWLTPTVERMRERGRWLHPFEAVRAQRQAAEEGRGDGQGMDGGAYVVREARERELR